MYFLISNLNKIIKTFFNSVFSLIPFYSNKITDRLNNSNFRNFIGYIKSNISDYNYVFHWDKLKESHQKKVVKSNLERKELLNNLYFQNTLNPTGTYTLGGFPYLFFVKTFKATYSHFIDNLRRTFSFGFYYIRGVVFFTFYWCLFNRWRTFMRAYSHFIDNLRRTFSFGFYYIRGVVFFTFYWCLFNRWRTFMRAYRVKLSPILNIINFCFCMNCWKSYRKQVW